MLIVLFCLLKLLFVSPAWAEEVYFDYSFKNPILNSEGVSEAVFGYELVDISEADFVVRAMSTAGVVSIWDETMGHWVEGTKSWADMPVLCEEMKIKLPVLEGATEVWFEVQNVQRGVVYKTPQHSIGGHSVSDNYFKALNENISF